MWRCPLPHRSMTGRWVLMAVPLPDSISHLIRSPRAARSSRMASGYSLCEMGLNVFSLSQVVSTDVSSVDGSLYAVSVKRTSRNLAFLKSVLIWSLLQGGSQRRASQSGFCNVVFGDGVSFRSLEVSLSVTPRVSHTLDKSRD